MKMMPKAFILLNTEIGSEEKVLQELQKIQGVDEVYLVYGVYDLVAKISSESHDILKNAIMTKIRQLESVRSTLTMIAMESE
jgi:DNA-binding Lrp family transcriptional regulator